MKWAGGPDEAKAKTEIDRILAEVDAQMSTWRDDSELSKIRAIDGPVRVSEPTYIVVKTALELARCETLLGEFEAAAQTARSAAARACTSSRAAFASTARRSRS